MNENLYITKEQMIEILDKIALAISHNDAKPVVYLMEILHKEIIHANALNSIID